MWSVFSQVGQFLRLTRPEPSVDLDAIASVLDTEDKIEDDEEEEYESEVPQGNGVMCQQRTGIVTALFDKHGFLTIYHRDSESENSRLFFNRKDGPTGLKEGHQVSFLIYKTSTDSDWVVRKILSIDNFWDSDGAVVDVDLAKSAIQVECETAFKNVIAKMSGREGRTIHAGQLQFSLDSVQIDFIPVEGDWLVLQALVSTEQEADTLLKVDHVRPLRARHMDGRVTHCTVDNSQGIVDAEALFTKDVCEPGYRPRVGDQVRAYCIESEQAGLMWRALRLVAINERPPDNLDDCALPLGDLLSNKQGIVISENTSCGSIIMGQDTQIEIEVKNEGECDHQLLGMELPKAESQFCLVKPHIIRPTDLASGESIQFVFKVRARYIGCSTELVVFKFSGFEIARQMCIDVQTAPLAASLAHQRGRTSSRQTPQSTITAKKLLATRNGFLVPGVKPIRPASFVPVNLGMYIVPEKLTKLMLGSEQSSKRKVDVLDRLLEQYGFLSGPLSAKDYVLRWDTLLHIEEIENCVNIARYNKHAGLRQVDEFLSLEIPGLAERRPSLIVGDRVIAKEAWTDENSWASDVKSVGYEGYIHRVLSNEVLLKFSPQFHDKCSGIYELSFEAGRTRFRREHQAVHVAYNNLGTSWMFPSKITLQTPQILIKEEKNYMKDETEINEPKTRDKTKAVGKDPESTPEDKKTVNEDVDGKVESDGNFFENNDLLLVKNKIPEKDCDTNIMYTMKPETKTVPEVNKIIDKEITYTNNFGLDAVEKSLSDILNIDSNVLNEDKNVEERHVKPKVSDMFEHIAANIGSNHKISPPRIPVVERFLKSGNCPKDKSPKEVKNMLQQLASMSPCEKPVKPIKQEKMKTLEEIEQLIIKESKLSNVLDGIQPLTDNLVNNVSHPVGNKRIANDSESIKNEGNILKVSYEKTLKNNQNETRQTKKSDSIKWNSNDGMKFGLEKEAYFKVPKNKRKLLTWFNHRLNHHQKEAIRNILRGEARPLPYVIFGPPGTGKTITMVETILQIYFLIPESRILVGTPSNSSADLVCERLVSSGVLAPGDLLRLMGHHYAESKRAPEAIRPYCGCADVKAKDDQRHSAAVEEGVVNMSRHAIGRHRITVGTCNTLAILYQMGFPRGHFTHVLIDEAGQATEPEILIPFSFLHPSWGQAVLAGDPLQLGPVVMSQVAEQLGLGQSLLSRLLLLTPYCRDPIGYPDTSGYNPHLVTKLRENYRSLPGILRLPNHMFYDGDLIAQVSVEDSEEAKLLLGLRDMLPASTGEGPPPAVLFHGIRGTNCQAPDSPSWHNPHEAVQAAMYLQAIYAHGLGPDDCGIITPYQAQALQIRQMLDTLEVPPPKVGSVEEFQGQERMVMILSAVRSSPRLVEKDLRHAVGFVASPQRLNVAITRARALLIVLANPHLLARDSHWRTVLAYCLNHQGYTGCDPPALPEHSATMSDG